MENSMVRQRVIRRTSPTRRRRKTPRADGAKLRKVIACQMILCVMLLIVVSIFKSINISTTNYVTDKVKYILSYDVELKNVFSYLENLSADIREKFTSDTIDKSVLEEMPTSITTTALSTTATSSSTLAPSSTPPPAEDTGDAIVADHSGEDTTGVMGVVLSASSEDDAFIRTDMLVPIEGTLSTLYGAKTDVITGTWKMHNGIDISPEEGGSIKAVLDGHVTDIGSAPDYGNYIRIEHGDRLQTVYANFSSVFIQENDLVKRGDSIADIGDAGAPVGIHLHFEVWKDGNAVDPLEYISVPAR